MGAQAAVGMHDGVIPGGHHRPSRAFGRVMAGADVALRTMEDGQHRSAVGSGQRAAAGHMTAQDAPFADSFMEDERR